MRVYLAARYGRRDELVKYAHILEAMGYTVTSTWLMTYDGVWADEKDLVWEGHALRDLEDIDTADAVISFTHPRGTQTKGGGRHVEFGYGYAKGKKMIVIGPRENVFHHLPGIEFYPDFHAFTRAQKAL